MLNEPAPWFFNLLQQGFQLQAEQHHITFAIIAAANSDDREARSNLDRTLRESSRDMLDLIPTDDNTEVGTDDIQKLLG